MRNPQSPEKLLEAMPDAIAIVGTAARFPGASNIEQYQSLLLNNECAIKPIPLERLAKSHHSNLAADKNYVAMAATLDNIEFFDAGFFDLTPREAMLIDPQQRHILECSWHAFESAGIVPGDNEEQRTAVFTSVSFSSYLSHYLLPRIQAGLVDVVEAGLSNNVDYAAARVAYKLNLTGPTIAVQTACSSSLVATHLACRSLVDGECDLALVAASSITVPNGLGYVASDKGMLAPDGMCRPFSDDAKGTIFANGAGALLLRRLDDALASGDIVKGIIRGTATNNDGSARIGFTAPNIDGQSAVISEAIWAAGIESEQIGYVEAHGTGTPLGDPIEMAALDDAINSEKTLGGNKIPVGTAKGNVGHLDTVAGMAGLFKILCAFETNSLPATLNLNQPNSKLDLANRPFRLLPETEAWLPSDKPRIAGLSSFGMGGTNAHAIIQEPPVANQPSAPARRCELILFSGQAQEDTTSQSQQLANHLQSNQTINLSDFSYTLRSGRRHFDARGFLVAGSSDEATKALAQERFQRSTIKTSSRKIAFVLPGQGSQYPDICKDLRASEPRFAKHHDHLRTLILEAGGPDICQNSLSLKDVQATELAQPILFAIGIALGKTLFELGIEPDLYIGHSIGELAVACLTGVMDEKSAIKLLIARSHAMSDAPQGSMIQLFCSYEKTLEFIQKIHLHPEEVLSPAVHNAPSAIVVGGNHSAIDRLQELVEANDIDCTRLRTSHAFHTDLMKPAAQKLFKTASTIDYSPCNKQVISTLTGNNVTHNELASADYWSRQILAPVLFDDALETALNEGITTFIELGPPGGLNACLTQIHSTQNQSKTAKQTLHPSTALLAHANRAKEIGGDHRAFLNGIGKIWLSGKEINWRAFDDDFSPRCKLVLPGYPFKQERHWPEANDSEQDNSRIDGKNQTTASSTAKHQNIQRGTELSLPRHPRPENAPKYIQATNETEQILSQLWEELLLIEPIGRDDDFIAMGGASITALQLVQAATNHGHTVTVKEIFDNRILKDLASYLEVKKSTPTPLKTPKTETDLNDTDEDFLDLETLGTIQSQLGSHN